MTHCALKTEEVISHVLEIIYLMTGEEYMIVKKPPLYKCSPQVSEDIHETRKSVLEIPADSPVHVRRTSGPASRVTCGMEGEAQKEFEDSTFQPPPSGAHVQIKCDDVAMYLSVEEWEYLEHHKEEYEVMTGRNRPSPADGPKDSDQRDCNSNDTMEETKTMDWNTENTFTACNVSYIGTSENVSSTKIESSDQFYRQNNMTEETCGPTHSRDVFALQDNLTLNHDPLSGIFLETEIKEEQASFECVMVDPEDPGVKINNSDEADGPSLDRNQNLFSDVGQNTCSHNSWSIQECLLDDLQRKTVNVRDSPVQSNYALDFVPQALSEDPQPTSILEGRQTKMAEFTNSGLLAGCTLDYGQSPFEDVLQKKHIKKEATKKRCSVVGQENKTFEVSDFSLKTSHTFTNFFNDLPQITHTRTEQPTEECSTDGHQTKKVDIKNCPLEKADTGTILSMFPNVYENAHIKRPATYQACFLDETKKVEINDFSVKASDGLYQLSNSFSDRPQRTCIKNEPIHQEHSTNGHQRKTMHKKNSDLVNSQTLSCDTSTLISHDNSKLTYQEHSIRSPQTKTVEVNHSIPENHSSLNTDRQTNNKSLTPLDFHYFIKEPVYRTQNSTWQSTARVQSRSKPPKAISCSDCGKVFSCNSYLSRHQRLHTGEKPFTCSECGKSFSWMSSLVTHKRTHLGEKPFSCKQCGKRFADYSGIIKHRRSHTGEKPYTCLLCGERFAQTYQLVKHQAVHLAEDVAEKPSNGQ